MTKNRANQGVTLAIRLIADYLLSQNVESQGNHVTGKSDMDVVSEQMQIEPNLQSGGEKPQISKERHDSTS